MDKPRSGASQSALDWGRGVARAQGMRYDDLEPPRRQAEPPYKVSTEKGGALHTWQRHTHAGIWKMGAALTDHPDMVAVFASEAAYEAALDAMPTDPAAWWAVTADRHDARVNGVHYQAILLGDTMDLTSCYPLTGRQYPKSWLNGLLKRKGKSSETFWATAEKLDDLWTEWGEIRGAPHGASDTAIGVITDLRQKAKDALLACHVENATKAVRALRAAWDKEKEVASTRAASEKATKDQRDKEIAETRTALGLAIEKKDVATVKTLYQKMVGWKTFISPPMKENLKKLGIEVVAD